MGKGKIIVVEGACDGIGKSTQYMLLEKYLLGKGEVVIKHHFPSYDTYHGKGVENYLKGEFDSPSEVSPYFVNNLYGNTKDSEKDFPGGPMVKNPPAKAGNTGSIPGQERFHVPWSN